MRVAVYVRVSTQHQAQSQTIEQQLDRLQAYSHGCPWLWSEASIFRDDGYSGASLHRPGLTHLREQVRQAVPDRSQHGLRHVQDIPRHTSQTTAHAWLPLAHSGSLCFTRIVVVGMDAVQIH